MAKNRLSKDQKRKQKLARKSERRDSIESLAYNGDKYRTKELASAWFQTELAIYEIYKITQRELLDRTVAHALSTMIKKLRAGTLPPLDPEKNLSVNVESPEEGIIQNIHMRWESSFSSARTPNTDQFVGILRTILGLIDTWSNPESDPQRYLHYIAEFLAKKVGVTAEVVSEKESIE